MVLSDIICFIFQEVRILPQTYREHSQSVKIKMNISKGYKKSTNIQAKWPMISIVSEEVRISIISRPELQKDITATHFLKRQGQV